MEQNSRTERLGMRSSIGKLTDALTGRTSAVPPAQLPWYSPEELAQGLCGLPDAAFDRYALEREPLAGKIPRKSWHALAEQARACGREEAQRLQNQYPGKSPEEICTALGLKIHRRSTPESGERVLYAQFVRPDEITVFTHCVETAAAIAQEEGYLSWLRPHRLEQVLLAHELFHAVEERTPQLFTRTYQIRLWSLGPIHNDSGLVILGEIAGMVFAKVLAGVPFSPFALDALLCYGYNPEGACGLFDEVLAESHA